MRRFQLERSVDLTGVSGTGVIAQGVQFDDGGCVLRWLTPTPSTALYASAADLEAIHGHHGSTRLVWLDDTPKVTIEYRPGTADEPAHLLGRRGAIIAKLRRSFP